MHGQTEFSQIPSGRFNRQDARTRLSVILGMGVGSTAIELATLRSNGRPAYLDDGVALQALKEVNPALPALYATLSEDQRKSAEGVLTAWAE